MAVRATVPSGGSATLRGVWLLPVRDTLSFVLWAASFMGRTVRWGRHRFAVDGVHLHHPYREVDGVALRRPRAIG